MTKIIINEKIWFKKIDISIAVHVMYNYSSTFYT